MLRRTAIEPPRNTVAVQTVRLVLRIVVLSPMTSIMRNLNLAEGMKLPSGGSGCGWRASHSISSSLVIFARLHASKPREKAGCKHQSYLTFLVHCAPRNAEGSALPWILYLYSGCKTVRWDVLCNVRKAQSLPLKLGYRVIFGAIETTDAVSVVTSFLY